MKGSVGPHVLRSTNNMWSLQHLFIFLTCIAAIKAQCSVTIRDHLPDPQPLVLKPGSIPEFRYPDGITGELVFAAGETVRLACHGTNNRFVNLGGSVADVIATCVSGTTFNVSGVTIGFSSLSCSFLPWHWQRRSGKTCLGSLTDIELGFDFGDYFLPVMNVCHNETKMETAYTVFPLVKEIAGFQSGFPRPSWFQGIFFSGYNMATQYNRATQIATLGTILGSADLSAELIHTNTEYYFARGHLTAKADFVYGVQHRVTFYYVNSAPQWQTFNGGNWESLESAIRRYTSNTYQDLTVYTGVHDIAVLPNVDGVLTEKYFYADDDGNRAIPIPKFFWKVIYNETTRLGTAFVGVNNPWLTEVTGDYYLCDDISSKISWLTWQPTSIPLGISYACEVDDLRKAIPTIPSFTVDGILV